MKSFAFQRLKRVVFEGYTEVLSKNSKKLLHVGGGGYYNGVSG